MRTVAYVDGYNLYYGCLKGSSYLWLDIGRLVQNVLHIQDPATELVRVKYFTAYIKARFASHGDASAQAQQTYFKALRASATVDIEIGDYSLEPSWAVEYHEPPDKRRRVKIWRFEEKRTDVNLALAAYRDAARGVEQVVFVTNDSDIVPAAQAIREDFPHVRIGVIFPIANRQRVGTPGGRRPPCGDLLKIADWTRRHVNDEELAASQFPSKVPTRKKPAIKPLHW